jgi:hypothetical protein
MEDRHDMIGRPEENKMTWRFEEPAMLPCLIYIYIYSLYIRSPGLPITRGSPGRTVQSGQAGPHPDVYKTGPGVIGFSFLRSTPIH